SGPLRRRASTSPGARPAASAMDSSPDGASAATTMAPASPPELAAGQSHWSRCSGPEVTQRDALDDARQLGHERAKARGVAGDASARPGSAPAGPAAHSGSAGPDPGARAIRLASTAAARLAAAESPADGATGSSLRPSDGRRSDPAVAAAELPPAIAQPTGPIGVQPKNWLAPGVCTMPTRTPALARPAIATDGLRPPTSRVWPSSVPTSAASPTVRARAGRPVILAASQAAVAPAAVATARTATSSVSADPSDASGPSASSVLAASGWGGRSATASAGARSVSRLTSSSWRADSGDLPVSSAPSSV